MAMTPASRAAPRKRSRSSRASTDMTASGAGKGHAFDEQRRSGGTEIAVEIACRHQIEEHRLQVRGDGHLGDRIDQLAILDPETGGATAVLAGQHVDALAEHFGDV